jgi:hypothetical protein
MLRYEFGQKVKCHVLYFKFDQTKKKYEHGKLQTKKCGFRVSAMLDSASWWAYCLVSSYHATCHFQVRRLMFKQCFSHFQVPVINPIVGAIAVVAIIAFVVLAVFMCCR